MTRRRLIVLALAVVALVVVVVAVWHLLARRLETQVALWADARRAEGFDLSWSDHGIGGFPFGFRLDLADARIARDGWTAASPRLSASLLPWRLDSVDLAAPRLDAGGPGGIGLSLDAVSGKLLLIEGRISSLVLDSGAAIMRAGGEETGRAASAHVMLDRFAPDVDWHNESLGGQVRLVQVAPARRFAGQALFDLPFDLSLTGAVKGPIHDLVRWRDGGGTLDLTALALAWGPLHLDGNATLALDGQMRPLGAGTTRLRGLEPTMDQLAARGLVKPNDASMAKVVLGLLARPAAEGGTEVTVPITAQDGRLFLGPVPILPLPRLAN
jgi:hypothetical protein